MMKNNKMITILIATLIAVAIGIVVFFSAKNRKPNISNVNNHNEAVINEIKENTNSTADTDIYDVEEEEYTGRQILKIKPNVQFETALAGILKNDILHESEIDELLKNKPDKSGIWVSKQSRDVFLKLLSDNGITQFSFDDEGYLMQIDDSKNNDVKLLKNAINSGKLFVLDFSGKYYIRDYLSGELEEEFFEQMDPDQTLQMISNENSFIIEVTTNSMGNLTSQEILEDILLSIE